MVSFCLICVFINSICSPVNEGGVEIELRLAGYYVGMPETCSMRDSENS